MPPSAAEFNSDIGAIPAEALRFLSDMEARIHDEAAYVETPMSFDSSSTLVDSPPMSQCEFEQNFLIHDGSSPAFRPLQGNLLMCQSPEPMDGPPMRSESAHVLQCQSNYFTFRTTGMSDFSSASTAISLELSHPYLRNTWPYDNANPYPSIYPTGHPHARIKEEEKVKCPECTVTFKRKRSWESLQTHEEQAHQGGEGSQSALREVRKVLQQAGRKAEA
ncbi:hypothetical protein K469DRAFT_713332 [Zopfia rhizophila CBS 207.26]|uniref:Uncharacterized protein n=1 Tax=Zopfia rhizophila CBS 207.26 TaxID=1314779 RepID=A0A6A6DU26_9PEZI|nr:hypothetical protein K469DRAFT_713332 [Zopfia rhizophila CBS 207.26]